MKEPWEWDEDDVARLIYELNLTFETVVVPPARIGSGGQQTDNNLSVDLSLVVSLSYPLPYLPTVRRIHEDSAGPWLFQAIVRFGEVALALCVFGSRTGIEREVKLLIECCEEIVWRGPFTTPGGEESRIEHGDNN